MNNLLDKTVLVESASLIESDHDCSELEATGYQQELYRGFNSLMAFSFCFTAVAIIPSLSALFPVALSTGGPIVILSSWIIGGILNFLVALSLGEICSTYPSAGSVYHWTGQLAPLHLAPLLSYITGWSNFIGNAAGDAFMAYSFSVSFSAAVYIVHGEKLTTLLQVLVSVICCCCWALGNILRVDRQGFINNVGGFWQVLTTFTIVISLFYSCTNTGLVSSFDEIFFTFYNGTGFESTSYVVLIGTLTALYSFTGYEAAGHMAEETVGAARSAPLAIVLTCAVSGLIGYLFLLGLDFGVSEIFTMCAGRGMSLLLTTMLMFCVFFSGLSSFTVTTRIGYAMARDGALPGSGLFKYISPTSMVPLGSVMLVFVIDVLLILLNIVNTTAFVAVTSIAVIGYQISYCIPILLRAIKADEFTLGAFNLGHFGKPMGYFCFTWLLCSSILFTLPTQYPVTLDNMNYSGPVLVIVTLFGAIHWFTAARVSFKGPIREG